MGCSSSNAASPALTKLTAPVRMMSAESMLSGASPKEKVSGAASQENPEISLAQLGIEVPAIPGDIALCGRLAPSAISQIGGRFKAWVNANGEDDMDYYKEELRAAGVQHLEVCLFPGPPSMPSDEQVEEALALLDKLPRPAMLQCTSGTRVGALLLLWLVKRRGYTVESAKKLAEDNDLKFWNRCALCGPMREWLIDRMPEQDGNAFTKKPMAGINCVQLFDPDSWAFTYLVVCEESQEAVLIDPSLAQVRVHLSLITEMGLNLRYVANTHAHANYTSSNHMVRKEFPNVRTVISAASGGKADMKVEPDEKLTFGKFSLEAVPTPGHTKGCVSWLLSGSPNMLFTGDSLLIRGCGRTDFREGDAGKLFDSIHTKLFSLPEDTIMYPGHDYKGRNVSTVGEEKRYNQLLCKSKDEFVKYMSGLELPGPKQTDSELPGNAIYGHQSD